MADTVTVRLDPEQRRLFDAEAAARGVGPSTLARELLDERPRELRRQRLLRQSAEAAERYHAAETAGEDLEAFAWPRPARLVGDGTLRGHRGRQPAMIAGQILWIDFRKDALPKEPNKLRPGIVVEDSTVFASGFPNVVVVPCTTALTFEVMDLCVAIEPDKRNGFDRINWAIAHDVTTTSKARIVKETDYHVSPEHLGEIRARISETLGV